MRSRQHWRRDAALLAAIQCCLLAPLFAEDDAPRKFIRQPGQRTVTASNTLPVSAPSEQAKSRVLSLKPPVSRTEPPNNSLLELETIARAPSTLNRDPLAKAGGTTANDTRLGANGSLTLSTQEIFLVPVDTDTNVQPHLPGDQRLLLDQQSDWSTILKSLSNGGAFEAMVHARSSEAEVQREANAEQPTTEWAPRFTHVQPPEPQAMDTEQFLTPNIVALPLQPDPKQQVASPEPAMRESRRGETGSEKLVSMKLEFQHEISGDLELSLAEEPKPAHHLSILEIDNPREPAASAQPANSQSHSVNIAPLQPADELIDAPEGRDKGQLVLRRDVPTPSVLISSGQCATQKSDVAKVVRSVSPIDAPPGWNAIAEELKARMANCEVLIRRNAYLSARQDAETAMLYLVRMLDLMANRYECELAWNMGLRALVEAEDFSSAQRLNSDRDFLRRIVASHQTPILRDVDVSDMSPLAAAQHYRQFAEQQFVVGSQGHPWASEVLYTIGRTYQAQAESQTNVSDAGEKLRWRAISNYRAACAIAPRNSLAANQLGYLLLKLDRPLDAREVLLASLRVQPSNAALENLVEASRRLRDVGLEQWAVGQIAVNNAMHQNQQQLPPVVELDARSFAAISPYSIGPTASETKSTGPNVFRSADSNSGLRR